MGAVAGPHFFCGTEDASQRTNKKIRLKYPQWVRLSAKCKIKYSRIQPDKNRKVLWGLRT